MTNSFFLILSILGYYFFNLDLLNIQYIPSIFTIIASIYYFFNYLEEIDFIHLIVFFSVILFFNILSFGSFDITLLREKIFKTLFLFCNILFSYLFCIHIKSFEIKVLNKFFMFFLIFVFVGVLFQTFSSSFNSLVQQFVANNFSKTGYIQNADFSLYGGLRPTFFSSEASHLGLKIFVISCFLSRINESFKLDIILIMLNLVLLYLVKTPTLLFFIFFIGSKYIRFNISTVISLIILLIVIVGSLNELFSNRLVNLALGLDHSFNRRLYIPLINTFHVFSNYPLGIGFTSGEQMINHIFDLNNNLGIGLEPQTMRSWNGFFDFLIFFGPIGSFSISLITYFFIKKINLQLKFYDFVYLIIISNFFNLLSIFLWQSIFIYLSVYNEK